jgi:hypothetical protein
MNNNKFSLFTLPELLELLAAFQSCSRNNKRSRALFDQLEQAIEDIQNEQ